MLATDISTVLFFCAQVLFVFSAFIFAISAIDDFFIDAYFYFYLSVKKVFQKKKKNKSLPLIGGDEAYIALMLPAWQESDVIVKSVANLINTIKYKNYHVFIGTYPNDWRTQIEVNRLTIKFDRVHKVVTNLPGPTCKADCLNSIVKEILLFEKFAGIEFAGFVLQDAEDIIHRSSLRIFSSYLQDYDLVQIPVYSLKREWNNFTGGHYMDEFAEFQGKEIRVREKMAKVVPGAGVGTAYSRRAVMYFRETGDVFNTNTLTEDYEFSLRMLGVGFKQVFADVRLPAKKRRTHSGPNSLWADKKGEVVATREFFPSKFWAAVRQKTRWTIGISLQGWKNFHWRGGWRIRYFFWRDRKMLFFAHAIAAGFISLGLFGAVNLYHWLFYDDYKFAPLMADESYIWYVVYFNLFMLANRILQRCYWTYSLYGWSALPFLPVRYMWGSAINYLAITRAIKIFLSHTFSGKTIGWDKTAHDFPDEIHTEVHPTNGRRSNVEEIDFVPPNDMAGGENQHGTASMLQFLLIFILLVVTPRISVAIESRGMPDNPLEQFFPKNSFKEGTNYRQRLERAMAKESFLVRQWRMRRSYAYFQKAEKLIRQGENDEALEVYDTYLKADPKHIVMQWDRLKLIERVKGPLEVEVAATELLEQVPFFGPAYISRAYARTKLLRMTAAKTDWLAALDDMELTAADQTLILSELLFSTYGSGYLTEAMKWCEQLLVYEPDAVEYLIFRAGLLEKLERREEAAEQWKDIVKISTDGQMKRRAVLASAVLLQEADRQQEAFAILNQAYADGTFDTFDTKLPQKRQFYTALARLAESVGWIKLALQSYEKLSSADPDSVDPLNLARLRILNGESAKVPDLIIDQPNVVLSNEDTLAKVLDLIHLLVYHKDLSTAMVLVKKALPEIRKISQDNKLSESMKENQTLVVLDLLFSSYQRGDLNDALKWCDQLLSFQSKVTEYHVFRAGLLEKLKQWEKAADEWQVIMRMETDAPMRRRAVLASAVLLQKVNKFQDAFVLLNMANEDKLFERADVPLAQRQEFYTTLALLAKEAYWIDVAVNAYEKLPRRYFDADKRMELAHLYILNGQPSKVPSLLLGRSAVPLDNRETLRKMLNLINLLMRKDYIPTATFLENRAFPAAEKFCRLNSKLNQPDQLWISYLSVHTDLVLKKGRLREAEASLAQLVELTEDYKYEMDYAAVLRSNGKTSKAVDQLSVTAQRNDLPTGVRAQAYADLAALLAKKKRFEEAGRAWHQAYLWDDNPLSSLYGIDAWEKAGDLEAAAAALEDFPVQRLNSKDQLVWYELAGRIWQQGGEYEKSLAAWRNAAALAPRAQHYYQMSDILVAQNRLQAANIAVEKALRLSPLDEKGLKRRAYIQMRIGNDAKAAQYLERSMLLDSQVEYKHFEDLGFVYTRMAENDKAVFYFNQALDVALMAKADDSQQMWEIDKDLSVIRGQIAELDRTFELALTESFHYLDEENHSFQISSQPWFNMGLGMLEAGYRPPYIGYRSGRILTLTGRVMWPNELNSVSAERDLLQAGLGIKYKPFGSINLNIASEYLFGLGREIEDQALLHMAHSVTHLPSNMSDPNAVQDFWKYFPYWQFYTDAGVIVSDENYGFIAHESRLGGAFKSNNDALLLPFGYLHAVGQARSNNTDRRLMMEAGFGASLHLPGFFNRYKGYRSGTELWLRCGYIFHATEAPESLSALVGLRVSFF